MGSSTVWLSTVQVETMRMAAMRTRSAARSAQRRSVTGGTGSADNVADLRQPHGVLHEFEPVVIGGGEDALGMELHGLDGEFAMAHAHDHAVFGLRGNFETGGQRFTSGEERMIAAHLKLRGQAFKHAHAAMADGGGLAVHGVIEHAQFAAEGFDDAL